VHRALEIAEELLWLPTAPLAEDLPLAYVRGLTEGTKGLQVDADAAGNLLVRTSDHADDPGPTVLVAHLDHPAFRLDDVRGGTATLAFRGGMAAGTTPPRSPVEFFRRGEPRPTGRGELLSVSDQRGWLTGALAAVTDGEALAGGFAVWAFPGFRLDGRRITARACDDLLGAAAALTALERAADAGSPLWGLFTRAEEIGLLGAFEAIRLGTVPREAAVVSLECSKALPGAPQGGGAIVRVGDRRTVFDAELTEALRETAERAKVPHQRKLMDGGVCEASAFGAAGYRASGLAVPLGNYHNAADAGVGVAAEHVTIEDYLAVVALLDALAERPPELGATAAQWVAERMAVARRVLGEGD